MIISAGIQFDGIIDGDNAVRIDLSNQADMIACDADGKVRFTRTIRTVARIFDGGTKATSGLGNATSTAFANQSAKTVPPSSGEATFSWTINAGTVLSAASYSVTITMTYNGSQYSATFTLIRTDATAIYQLLPSLDEIKFSKGSDNTLAPSSVDLYCGYTKDAGSGLDRYPGNVLANLAKRQTITYHTCTAQELEGYEHIEDVPTQDIVYTGSYNIFYRSVTLNQSGGKSYGDWTWMRGAGQVIDLEKFYDSSNPQGTIVWTTMPTGILTINSNTTWHEIEFILSDANGVGSISDSNTIDRETIPIIKDGLDGQNSVRLALDNEHENFLFDGMTLVAPSEGSTSRIRLYDGQTDKTGDLTIEGESPTLTIYSKSGVPTSGNNVPTITGSAQAGFTLNVKTINAATAKVTIKAVYKNKSYYADFTANKTNQDKYDIVCKPSSIAYNATTYASSESNATIQTVSLSATGIGIGGTKFNPSLSGSVGAGKLCVFWAYVSADGTIGSFSNSPVTSKAVIKNECDNYVGIYFELRYYTTASAYRVCDYETVEIAKAANGASVSRVDKYFKATSSNTTPSTPAQTTPTEWTLNASPSNWNAANRYMWCQEKTTLTNGNTVWSSVYLHSVWGQPGKTGHTARWYEYAGEYGNNLAGSLSNTDDHGWYVKRGKYFFMLIAESGSSVSTDTVPTSATTTTDWEYMGGDRQYYMAKAFFGEYAQFGSAIINGDWMMSKYGTVNGEETDSYTSFDPKWPKRSNVIIGSPVKIYNYSDPADKEGTMIISGHEADGNAGRISNYLNFTAGKTYRIEVTACCNEGQVLWVELKKGGTQYASLSFTSRSLSTKYIDFNCVLTGTKYEISASVPCKSDTTDTSRLPTSGTVVSVTCSPLSSFCPYYAIDMKMGRLIGLKAEFEGDIIANKLISYDSQFKTEVYPGSVAFTSFANPLASIVIGADDNGMFFKMTDKSGKTIWNFSTSGNGKITSGGGDYTVMRMRRVGTGVSTNPPSRVDCTNGDNGYGDNDMTTYHRYNGSWYTDGSGAKKFNTGEEAKDGKTYTDNNNKPTENLLSDGWYVYTSMEMMECRKRTSSSGSYYSITAYYYTGGKVGATKTYHFQ